LNSAASPVGIARRSDVTATATKAARVRESVAHPIIDADGHFVEIGPILHD
jgi:hypothetical protein